MQPVIFHVPIINWDIPGYGLMLTIGFLLSIMWAAWRAQRSKANPDVLLNIGFIALIFGIIGARTMFVVHYWDNFKGRGNAVQVAWEVINVTKGGLEVYGGFIAASIATVIYLVVWKHSLRWYLDICAPSAALGLAFGRVGCFLNGCCWGGVCALPWAVTFPYGSNPQLKQWQEQTPGAELPQQLIVEHYGVASPLPLGTMHFTDEQVDDALRRLSVLKAEQARDEAALAAATDVSERARLSTEIETRNDQMRAIRQSVPGLVAQLDKYGLDMAQFRKLAAGYRSAPVHPTQLYSALGNFLLAGLLSALYWRRRRDGVVISLFFILQPLMRAIMEEVRVDNPEDTFFGLTISQSIAVAMMGCGVFGLMASFLLPPRSPRATEWEPPAEPPKTKAKPAAG